MIKFPQILILLIIVATSCRKDNEPSDQDLKHDEARQPFIGNWNFTMTHYFEGHIYDEENDTSVFGSTLDTIWVKEGSISVDPDTYHGLVVNYGPNENDFIIYTDGLDVTCMSNCENAGYDTLGPFANWWYLAEGTHPFDSNAIYNLGVSEYYGSPNSWAIVGYPQ